LVRPSESKLVSRLFLFEFFQGSSIAIFFTTGISIFLEKRSTSELPKVFVLSAALLWLCGFIYNKLEHKLSVRSLILSVLVFNLASIVVFRLLMTYEDNQWFLYIFLAFFNVLYLLNNLEFWGLAAILFDVRQSKRLFGIVSAGDIPAKMLGYIAALVWVPLIGTENLLWLAAGFISVSFFLFEPLMQLTKTEQLNSKNSHHHSSSSVHAISAAITGNKLIRKAALVSFFSFCCLIVVNFIFYGYVKHEFKNDKALAGFFAVFLAVIRGITLIIKLAGTNRMVDKIGLRRSLLLTPMVLGVLCLLAIYFSFRSLHESVFYLFGVMAITLEVLRSAIQSPVLLSTMQPLPTHQRLRGHTIMKGFMDPFAFLMMGTVLWILPDIEGPMNFTVISFILLALVIGWAWFSISVDRDYIETLQSAIRDRSLNPRDISFTDKDSLDLLLKKIEDGSETEAIAVLQLVASQTENRAVFFEKALMHPSNHVKQYTLSLVRTRNARELLPALKQSLASADNRSLPQLIKTIASLDPAQDFSSYLDHTDADVVQAATLASLKSANREHLKAETNLQHLFDSSAESDKINALHIAGELKAENYSKHVAALLHSTSAPVQKAARRAAAKIGDAELVDQLMEDFSSSQNDADILEALEAGAETCVRGIKSFLVAHKCNGVKSRRLITVLGKKGGKASVSLLEECLRRFPENANAILLSLHQANVKSTEGEAQYLQTIRENLMAASHIIFKIRFAEKTYKSKLVARALELELTGIRNKCLWLFSFLYDAEKIRRAQAGFELNTKESMANAIELIQLAVPREFALPFSVVFENASIEEKCMQIRRNISEPLINDAALVKNILFDVDYLFNNWTKACVLYNMANQGEKINAEFVEPFRQSESKVLKNTAEYLLSRYE
jgi:AAA family ATP:ADP antiporter